MGVDVLDPGLDLTEINPEELFEERRPKQGKSGVDARRRLEQKLDELKLARELRDYDFD